MISRRRSLANRFGSSLPIRWSCKIVRMRWMVLMRGESSNEVVFRSLFIRLGSTTKRVW